MTRPFKSAQLPIRTRRVVSRQAVELDKSVSCPARHSTPLEVCRTCENLDAIVLDRDGLECRVCCRPPQSASGSDDNAFWPRFARRMLPPSARRIPVSTVMTSSVTCVTCDLGVEAVASLFLDEQIGALPVVDYERQPIGILTKTDLLRSRLGDASFPQVAITDLMTPVLATVREDDSLSRAASLMLEHRIHHLPVVDEQSGVVGMVSTFDFARWIALSPTVP
jgi:CBS domain-containing protein